MTGEMIDDLFISLFMRKLTQLSCYWPADRTDQTVNTADSKVYER
jgi:hypothetical protein